MSSELICVDCGNKFFGSKFGPGTFCEGLGRCSICHSSRQANERFEKEMAERKKYERQSSRVYSDSFSSSPSSYSSSSSAANTDGLGSVFATFAIIAVAVVIGLSVLVSNSTEKEYSFYTPNNGSLKQSLVSGVVYHQYKCGKHSGLTDDPASCVEIPKEDFERFCNEFDGINTIDNKAILGQRTGEITSLSREVDRSYDRTYCRIEFSMNVYGEVKIGMANVITWTVNADGKLVPYSSYGSTRWK